MIENECQEDRDRNAGMKDENVREEEMLSSEWEFVFRSKQSMQ
jgi:hypothetical protein